MAEQVCSRLCVSGAVGTGDSPAGRCLHTTCRKPHSLLDCVYGRAEHLSPEVTDRAQVDSLFSQTRDHLRYLEGVVSG